MVQIEANKVVKKTIITDYWVVNLSLTECLKLVVLCQSKF